MALNSDHPGDSLFGARYARHEALKLIGPSGQKKLLESSVLVLGCGSLGSAQAMLLARAGVGRLILADRDVVEDYNLVTQVLYDEDDVKGRLPKAEAAARRLRAINSSIKAEPAVVDVSAANVEGLVAKADLVMDGTDNYETRFLINDAAVKAGKPWVYGGVLGTSGMVMPVRPGQGPCLRCLFELPPKEERLPHCNDFGVLNAAVAWAAALQVTEALKILAGVTDESTRLYTLDIWNASAGSVAAQRAENCPCCGQRRFDFLGAR